MIYKAQKVFQRGQICGKILTMRVANRGIRRNKVIKQEIHSKCKSEKLKILTDINLPIYDMAISTQAHALAKNDRRNSRGTLQQKETKRRQTVTGSQKKSQTVTDSN